MGAGYQVIYDDLADMATTFRHDADYFSGLRSQMAPAPVDGGDATVNDGISAVMSLFDTLNATITTALDGHAKAVQGCHDDYKNNDSDVAVLYNKLIADA